MEYYLLVSAFTYAVTLIPEKYSSEEACREAGKASKMQYHYCVPAPVKTMCSQIIPNTNVGFNVPCSVPTGK
jgi:hypothetical protein